MTEQDWFKLYSGDIATCKTLDKLRKWAVDWHEDLKKNCPTTIEALRVTYRQRIDELKNKF